MTTFDHLLLLGRPAAGKSELIDLLKRLPDVERAKAFHIGRFEEMDDFPWLWEKFLEDNLWEESTGTRLYSHREENNYGLNEDAGRLFDLMMVRFNHETRDRYLSRPEFYQDATLFIEFSRGRENGYRHAFELLSQEILERAAILYVDVTFEESWRRNLARYEEKKKHSILAHMATRRVMESHYRINDWAEISSGSNEGYLALKGLRIPFVTVNNEPELKEDKALAARYQPAFDRLWKLYGEK